MKITPCLWFDNNAEEAIQHYMSIFKDSKLGDVSRNLEGGAGPAGTLLTATFTLLNQEVMVINGGPYFKHSEAFSFFVACDGQAEVDDLWARLSDGGEGQCGWLKDRFGVSWQIVPRRLMELMGDKDPVKAGRVMQAMLKMKKLDVAGLEAAYRGDATSA